MSPREIFALRDHLSAELKGRTLSDAHDVVSLTDILSQTVLGGRLRELSGRAVLLKLSDQLRSGLAMIELDGIARRMLLCPPDLNPAHLDALIVDVYLPVIDGAKVIATARGELGLVSLPIIAVSAGGDTARRSALDAGANIFLDKPMRLRQVIDTIQKLLT